MTDVPSTSTAMSTTSVAPSTTESKTSVEMNTVSTKTSKSARMSLQRSTPRFGVTLLMLTTIAGSLIVTESFLTSTSTVSRFIGGLLALFVGLFAFTWMRIHSLALSRRRRAYFDEANILETYQPRARTLGHLFHPDPPTPSPFPTVQIAEPTDPELHTNEEKATFNANRDAHYANMFEQAMRLNKEMDVAEKQNKVMPATENSVVSDVTQHSEGSSHHGSKDEVPQEPSKTSPTPTPVPTGSQRSGRSVKLTKKKKNKK